MHHARLATVPRANRQGLHPNPDTDTAASTTSAEPLNASNDNEPAVDNAEDAPAEPEPVPQLELEASNDNQQTEDLPATGTDHAN